MFFFHRFFQSFECCDLSLCLLRHRCFDKTLGDRKVEDHYCVVPSVQGLWLQFLMHSIPFVFSGKTMRPGFLEEGSVAKCFYLLGSIFLAPKTSSGVDSVECGLWWAVRWMICPGKCCWTSERTDSGIWISAFEYWHLCNCKDAVILHRWNIPPKHISWHQICCCE